MTNTQMVSHIIHHQPQIEPKPRALLALLEYHKPKNALILCYEAAECDLLARFLSRYAFATKAIHEESARELPQAIENLSQKKGVFVICQNNLIDEKVPLGTVDFLVNYDMPERAQIYERITQFRSHNNQERKIVSLISNKETSYITNIKSQLDIDFKTEPLPNMNEILVLSSLRILKNLVLEAKDVELTQYEDLAKEMLKHEETSFVLSFLLKNYISQKFGSAPMRESLRDTRGERSFTKARPERSLPLKPEKTERPKRASEGEHEELVKKPTPKPSLEEVEPIEQLSTVKEDQLSKEEPTANLYITLGKQDGINDLASLAQFLSTHAKVDLGHFSGGGMIREQSSHIDVDQEVADQIIKAINGQKKPGDEEALITCQRAQPTTGKFVKRPMRKRMGHFNKRKS